MVLLKLDVALGIVVDGKALHAQSAALCCQLLAHPCRTFVWQCHAALHKVAAVFHTKVLSWDEGVHS